MPSIPPPDEQLRQLRVAIDRLFERLRQIESRLARLETAASASPTADDLVLPASAEPATPIEPAPPPHPPQLADDEILVAELIESPGVEPEETRESEEAPQVAAASAHEPDTPTSPDAPAPPPRTPEHSRQPLEQQRAPRPDAPAPPSLPAPAAKHKAPAAPQQKQHSAPDIFDRVREEARVGAAALSDIPLVARIRAKFSQQRAESGGSWETVIGQRWLTWAGAITLIVAIGFAVHWAWRHFDTPDWVKVAAFHALGLALLAGGHLLDRRRLRLLAGGLAGMGVFTLYAIAFAALHLYKIWGENGETITFIECAIITVLAIAISIRANSVTIVLLGALGGYLTPLLTASGSGHYVGWFTYLAFLNVALIGCAVLKGWSFLKPLAWLGAALMFWLWTHNSKNFLAFYDEKLWPTQWLLTIHGAIFLFGATLPPLVWRRRSTQIDISALVSGSLWFMAMTYFLFHQREDQQLALVSWGLAFLHLALFAVTYGRVSNVDRMPRVQLALAAIFFTLAVPLQLDDPAYLSAAWCAEGLVFAIVSVYFHDRQMGVSTVSVFLLAAGRMFFDFFTESRFVENTEIDVRFLIISASAIMAIAAGCVFRFLPRLLRDEFDDRFESIAGAALVALGNLALLVSVTCQWQDRTVLLLWTIDAAVVWTLGFWALSRALSAVSAESSSGADGSSDRIYWASLLCAYGAVLAVIFAGGRAIYHFDELRPDASLITNARLGTLALLAAVYFVFGWLSRRQFGAESLASLSDTPSPADARLTGNAQSLRLYDLHMPLACLASAVLLAACGFEIHKYFTDGISKPATGSPPVVEMLAYSVFTAIFAFALLAVGRSLRYPIYRALALGGSFFILAKLMVIDFQLDAASIGDSGVDYRFAAGIITCAVVGLSALWVVVLRPASGEPPAEDEAPWLLVEQPFAAVALAGANVVAMFAPTCQWDHRLVLVLWTLDAAAVFAISVWLDNRLIRLYAAAIALLMVGGRALWESDSISSEFQLVLNDRFLSLALVAALYFAASWLFHRVTASDSKTPPRDFDEQKQLLGSIFSVLGNVALLAALTMDVHTWFATELAARRAPFPDMRMAEQATYSIVWAVYAVLIVTAGFLLRYRLFRLLGLLGFAAVLAKVFLIDLASLDLLPRVLALAVLGVALLAASFLYQRFSTRLQQRE